MLAPSRRTVAAAVRHERLAGFLVSRHGALIAAFNVSDSAVIKIADVRGTSVTDAWHTIIQVTASLNARKLA